MSLNAKFVADFSSFKAAVDQAQAQLKDFASGANAVEKSLNRVADSFSGRKLIQDATLAAEAVEQLGGASKLTDAELERLGTQASQAVDKMSKLGIEAPQNLRDLASASKEATEAGKGMLGYLDDLGHSFVARVAEGVLLRDAIRDVVAFTKEAFADAAKFDDLSRATGLSVETIQRFNFVAPEFGLTLEEMARGVEQLSSKLARGDGNAIQAIQALGLNVEQLLARGPKEAFLEITEAAGRVQDPMQRAAIASGLFGERLSKELLPALGELREKLNAVPQQAIISDDDVTRAKQLETALSHAFTWAEAMVVKLATLPSHIGFGAADFSGGTGPTPTSPGPVSIEEQNGFNAALVETGKDIELVSQASERLLSRTDLINNRLKALKDEALSPLSDAQKAQILQLKDWGESEKDIADLVGSNVVAVHRYIDANKQLQEEQRKTAAESKKAAEEWQKLQDQLYKVEHEYDGMNLNLKELSSLGEHVASTTLVSEATAMQNLSNKIFQVEHGLDGMNVNLEKVGEHVPIKPIKEATDNLGEFTKALSELATISGGAFGGFIKDIGQVVAALNTAEKAQKSYDEAIKAGGSGVAALAGEVTAYYAIITAGVDKLNNLLGLKTGQELENQIQSNLTGVGDLIRQITGATGPIDILKEIPVIVEKTGLTADQVHGDLQAAFDAKTPQDFANAIKPIQDALAKVASAANDVAAAVNSIPTDVNISAGITFGAGTHPEGAASGGLVTPTGIQYLGNGGLVIPRGTDTVPAMLTPGERVLSRADAVNYDRGGASQTFNTSIVLQSNATNPQQMAEYLKTEGLELITQAIARDKRGAGTKMRRALRVA